MSVQPIQEGPVDLATYIILDADEGVKILDETNHLSKRKQIYSAISNIFNQLEDSKGLLKLDDKIVIAKKTEEIESHYKQTHSAISHFFNVLLTKVFHLHTDYDIVDAIHQHKIYKKLMSDAIEKDDARALVGILNRGISPNMRIGADNEFALLQAAKTGKIACMKALIQAGAKVTQCSYGGQFNDALMWLVSRGQETPENLDGIEFLMKHKPHTSDIARALNEVFRGKKKSLEVLLRSGANPNDIVLRNYEMFDEKTLKLVLDYKIDPKKLVNTYFYLLSGQTVLESSARLKMITQLLDNGLSKDSVGEYPFSPLDLVHSNRLSFADGSLAAKIYFTLLERGATRIYSPGTDDFKSMLDFVNDPDEKLHYKWILLTKTNLVKPEMIKEDPDFQRIKLELEVEKKVPQPIHIYKRDLRKDALIDVGRVGSGIKFAANRLVLEKESEFFDTHFQQVNEEIRKEEHKGAENLYELPSDVLKTGDFQKVLAHMEGMVPYDHPEDRGSAFHYLMVKPYTTEIDNFSWLWDEATGSPRDHFIDMKIPTQMNEGIPIHKTVLAAMSTDNQVRKGIDKFIKRFEPIVIKNALKFIYTRDVSHLTTNQEVLDVAILCSALGIKKEYLADLGTHYYELLDMSHYQEPGLKEKLQLERMPVGKINFNAFKEIIPEQFCSIVSNISKDILPKIEIAHCENLGEKELEVFKEAFKAKLK